LFFPMSRSVLYAFYGHTCTHTHTLIRTHTRTYYSMHTHTHLHAHTDTFMHTHTSTKTRSCCHTHNTYTCMHAHRHKHTCKHTHTHTYWTSSCVHCRDTIEQTQHARVALLLKPNLQHLASICGLPTVVEHLHAMLGTQRLKINKPSGRAGRTALVSDRLLFLLLLWQL